MGAAYGTWRSGATVAAIGPDRPDLVMKVRLCLAAAISRRFQAVTDSLPVTPPNGYGGYHIGVRTCSVPAHSWGYESVANTALLFVQVRKLGRV